MTCECNCEFDCKCAYAKYKLKSDNKMLTFKKFDTALIARNFEIDMLWKRSNYFLAFNAAVAVGFFSLITKNIDIYAILFCLIGTFVCLTWCKVNLGSKFQQLYWEDILTEASNKIGIDYFMPSENAEYRVNNQLNSSDNVYLENFYNTSVLTNPSTSKWMIFLSILVFFMWLSAGAFISYEVVGLLGYPMWFGFWSIVHVTIKSPKIYNTIIKYMYYTINILIVIIISINVIAILMVVYFKVIEEQSPAISLLFGVIIP